MSHWSDCHFFHKFLDSVLFYFFCLIYNY
jgi:hypothetical protein